MPDPTDGNYRVTVRVDASPPIVVVQPYLASVTVSQYNDTTTVLSVGQQGPAGPQGPQGANANYTLPIATNATLGGVIVGANLTVDANGVLAATAAAYTLPVATNGTLGGVIVGSSMTITDGVLNASTTGYVLESLTGSSFSVWPSTPETLSITRHSKTVVNSTQYGSNTPSYGTVTVRGWSATNISTGGPVTTNMPAFEVLLTANGDQYYNPNGPPTQATPITNAFRVRMVRGSSGAIIGTVVEVLGAISFTDYYDVLYNMTSTQVLTRKSGDLLYRPFNSTVAWYVNEANRTGATAMNQMMCDERYVQLKKVNANG